MRYEIEERQQAAGAYASDDSECSEIIDPRTGQYRIKDTWHEGMEVRRGQAMRRLDLEHGFFLHIVSARS